MENACGNFETVMQTHWVEDDETCVSSISNVSDPNKERRKKERRANKTCNSEPDSGVPMYVCDAKEPSKVLGEIIREIKQGGSSSPCPQKEHDITPPLDVGGTTAAFAILPREHLSLESPDRSPRLRSSPHCPSPTEFVPEKVSHPRQATRRASFETPRIRSRRASIGGTTFYPTSHMANVDTLLRGSGLRLKNDGTCTFLFEEKKFLIETTAETSEFLFYCSLGTLSKWKKVWPKKLLKMMAIWNEEQIIKSPEEGCEDDSKESGDEEKETEDNIGLLRIDSSKGNDPFVAFIYFGHVNKIKDSTHFRNELDKFVDDALNFHKKLAAGPEADEVKDERQLHQPPSCNLKSSKTSTSTNTTCLTSSISTCVEEGVNALSNTSEEATPASFANPSHGHDDHSSCKKSGVFTKMIQSLRSKSKEDIARLAFVDPNQNSAFVVDTSAADDLKRKISRQHSRRRTEDNHQPRSRRGSAYTEESQSQSRRGSAIDDENRSHSKKGASFHADGRTRGPSQKSSSFFHDDFSGSLHYPTKKVASHHVEEKRASSSLHKPSRSDRRISSPDTLNNSIDALNLSDRYSCRSSRFHKSEPVLSQEEHGRHETSEHRSRRASSRPRRQNDPPIHAVGRLNSIHPEPSCSGGEMKEKSGSRRTLAPPAPPSRPPGLGHSRSSSRSRSALRTCKV